MINLDVVIARYHGTLVSFADADRLQTQSCILHIGQTPWTDTDSKFQNLNISGNIPKTNTLVTTRKLHLMTMLTLYCTTEHSDQELQADGHIRSMQEWPYIVTAVAAGLIFYTCRHVAW